MRKTHDRPLPKTNPKPNAQASKNHSRHCRAVEPDSEARAIRPKQRHIGRGPCARLARDSSILTEKIMAKKLYTVTVVFDFVIVSGDEQHERTATD